MARAEFFRIRFSADPVQLIFFRPGLDRWLQGLDWPEPDRIDAILATSEACTNAVEHAYAVGYPGDVEVVGRLVHGPDDRHLVLVVRDWGRWRPDPTGRGYGLTAMRACMKRVRVSHDENGTTITMISNPVSAVPAQA